MYFVPCLNFPILAIVLWKRIFPGNFVAKAAASIILLSLMTDLLAPVLPHYQGNALLAALFFAGAFMGSGLAMGVSGNLGYRAGLP